MGNMQMKFFTIESTPSNDNANFVTEYPGMFLRKNPYTLNGVNCSLNRCQTLKNCTTLQYRSLSGILRQMTPGTKTLKCGCLNHYTCPTHDHRTCTTYPTNSGNPFLGNEAKTNHDHKNREYFPTNAATSNQSPELSNVDKTVVLHHPTDLSNIEEPLSVKTVAPKRNTISVPKTPQQNNVDKISSSRRAPTDSSSMDGSPVTQKPARLNIASVTAKKPNFSHEPTDLSNINEPPASQTPTKLVSNGVTKSAADVSNVDKLHFPQPQISLSSIEKSRSSKTPSSQNDNAISVSTTDALNMDLQRSENKPSKLAKIAAPAVSPTEASPDLFNVGNIKSPKKPLTDLSTMDEPQAAKKPSKLKNIASSAAKKGYDSSNVDEIPSLLKLSTDVSSVDEPRAAKKPTKLKNIVSPATKKAADLSNADEIPSLPNISTDISTMDEPRVTKKPTKLKNVVSPATKKAADLSNADEIPSLLNISTDISTMDEPRVTKKPTKLKNVVSPATKKAADLSNADEIPSLLNISTDVSSMDEPRAAKKPTKLKNIATPAAKSDLSNVDESPSTPSISTDLSSIGEPRATKKSSKLTNFASPTVKKVSDLSHGAEMPYPGKLSTGVSSMDEPRAAKNSSKSKNIATTATLPDLSNVNETSSPRKNSTDLATLDLPSITRNQSMNKKIETPTVKTSNISNTDENLSSRDEQTDLSSLDETGAAKNPVEVKNIATPTANISAELFSIDGIPNQQKPSNSDKPRAAQKTTQFMNMSRVDETPSLQNPANSSNIEKPRTIGKPSELKNNATSVPATHSEYEYDDVQPSEKPSLSKNISTPDDAVPNSSTDVLNVDDIHVPQAPINLSSIDEPRESHKPVITDNAISASAPQVPVTPKNQQIDSSKIVKLGLHAGHKPNEIKNTTTPTVTRPINSFKVDEIPSSQNEPTESSSIHILGLHAGHKPHELKKIGTPIATVFSDIHNLNEVKFAEQLPAELSNVDEPKATQKPFGLNNATPVPQTPSVYEYDDAQPSEKPSLSKNISTPDDAVPKSSADEPDVHDIPSPKTPITLSSIDKPRESKKSTLTKNAAISAPQVTELTDVLQVPSPQKPSTKPSSIHILDLHAGNKLYEPKNIGTPTVTAPSDFSEVQVVKEIIPSTQTQTNKSKVDEPQYLQKRLLKTDVNPQASSNVPNVEEVTSPKKIQPDLSNTYDSPRDTQKPAELKNNATSASQTTSEYEYDKAEPSDKPYLLRDISTQVELQDLPNLAETKDAQKSSDILTGLKTISPKVLKKKSTVSFKELPESYDTRSKPKPTKSKTTNGAPISKKKSSLKTTKTTPVLKKASAPSNTSAQIKPSSLKTNRLTSQDKKKQNSSKSRSQRSVSTSQLKASPARPTKSKYLRSASVKNLKPSSSPSRGMHYPSKLNRPQQIKATTSNAEEPFNDTPKKSNHFIADTLPRTDLKKTKSFYQKNGKEKQRRTTMFKFSPVRADLTPHFQRFSHHSLKPKPKGYIPLSSRSKPAPTKPPNENPPPDISGPGNIPKIKPSPNTTTIPVDKPTTSNPKKVSLDQTSRQTTVNPKKVSLNQTSTPTTIQPKKMSMDQTFKPTMASQNNDVTGRRASSPKAKTSIELPKKPSIAKPAVPTVKSQTEFQTLISKSKSKPTVSDEKIPPPPPFPFHEIPYHRVQLKHTYYEPPPFILKKKPSRRTTTSGNNLNNNVVALTFQQSPTPAASKKSIPSSPVVSPNPQEGAMELSRIAPEDPKIEFDSSESVVFFYPPENTVAKAARDSAGRAYSRPPSSRSQVPPVKRSSTNNYKVPSAANVRRTSKPIAIRRDKKLMNNLRTEYETYIENYDTRLKTKRNGKDTSSANPPIKSASPADDNLKDSDGNNVNGNPCLGMENLFSCDEFSSQASSQQSCSSISRCSQATDSSEIANRVISDCSSIIECERRNQVISNCEPTIGCERRNRVTPACEPTVDCERLPRSPYYFYVCNFELGNDSLQIPSDQDDILRKKLKYQTEDGMKTEADENNNTDSEIDIAQSPINPTYVDTDLDDEIQFIELRNSMEDFCPRPIPPLPSLDIELDLTPCASISDVILPESRADTIITTDKDDQIDDDDLEMGTYLSRVMKRTKTLLSGSSSIVSEMIEESESLLSSYESSISVHSDAAVSQLSNLSSSENERAVQMLTHDHESDYDGDIEGDAINDRFRARTYTNDSETPIGRNQIKRNPALLRIRGSVEASESEDDSVEYRKLVSRYNPETVAKLKNEYLGLLDNFVQEIESYQYDDEDCSGSGQNDKQSDSEDGINFDSGPISSNDSLVTSPMEIDSSDYILPGRPRVSGSSSSPATARRYDYLIPPENGNILMNDSQPRGTEWASGFSSDQGPHSIRPGTLISVLKKRPGSSPKVSGENKYVLDNMKSTRSVHFDIPPTP